MREGFPHLSVLSLPLRHAHCDRTPFVISHHIRTAVQQSHSGSVHELHDVAFSALLPFWLVHRRTPSHATPRFLHSVCLLISQLAAPLVAGATTVCHFAVVLTPPLLVLPTAEPAAFLSVTTTLYLPPSPPFGNAKGIPKIKTQ